MANILAVDSAFAHSSVALLSGGTVVSERSDQVRGDAGKLLPMIDSVLSRHSIQLKELDAICVTCGPGSFTGIRIGISIVQGLAYGAGLKVYPFDTLELIAWHCVNKKKGGTNNLLSNHVLVPILDARMDERYWSAYRIGEGYGLHLLSPPGLCHSNKLLKAVSTLHQGASILFVGEALTNIASESTELGQQVVCEPGLPEMPAELMIQLLQANEDSRTPIDEITELEPCYLRAASSWKKRQRIRSTESNGC